jgi:hypothetical protein
MSLDSISLDIISLDSISMIGLRRDADISSKEQVRNHIPSRSLVTGSERSDALMNSLSDRRWDDTVPREMTPKKRGAILAPHLHPAG